MEIRDTKPVSGAAPLRKARATRDAGGADAPSPIEETVLLAGVPESEMTPRVRQALMGLLGEVDRLRRELDESRNRIAFLERLADEDSLMPIANRRAFVRELSRMMAFAEFGVLLVQTDEETAIRKADSLAASIVAQPLLWQDKLIALSAAYGTHSFHGNENAAEALDAADRAMYERKKKRREGDK